MSNTRKIKAKKVSQPKKTSAWSKIWSGTKYFLKSLFSNDICVDARTKKWYWAILIAVVSLVVATIPTMVNYFKVKGGSFLDSTTYNYDSQVYAFTQYMDNYDIKLKVENGTLVDEGNTCTVNDDNTIYKHVVSMDVAYKNSITGEVVETTDKYVDFAVYFYPDALYTKKKSDTAHSKLSDLITEVLNGKNPKAGDEEIGEKYTINALFLGKESFTAVKYTGISSSGTVSRSSITYKYQGANQNGDTTFYLKDLLGADKAATVSNWKVYLNNAYTPIKLATGWASTGITFGIYTALTILLGFVVWIMTRGKNNPFRIYTFWECQKIAYWAALTPAIIGMLIGFFMSSMMMLGFILCYGVRIMWMSMRSLRPYQDEQK